MKRLRGVVVLSLVVGATGFVACGGSGDTGEVDGNSGGTKKSTTKSASKGGGTGSDNGSAANGSDTGTDNGSAANGSDNGSAANGSDNGSAANGSDNGSAANGSDNGSGANGSDTGTDSGLGGNGSGASGGAPGSGGDGNGGTFQGKACMAQGDCNDGNACTTDACDEGVCEIASKPNPSGSTKTDCGGGKLCINGKCTTNVCGDGVKLGAEECDDGAKNGKDGICSTSCTIASCGDKIVQSAEGEACDDGNMNDFDACLSNCKFPGNSDGTPFDIASSQGLDTDANGDLIIDPKNVLNSMMTKRYLWVANSGEGTESKIDTDLAVEVGRFCTAPGCGADPSRSTVGLSGDVVVANRHGGSSLRIIADQTQCVDKNGNGHVDSSGANGADPHTPMGWGAGVGTSPDECVQWFHDFNNEFGQGTLPRAAGFDALVGDQGQQSTYVYIGLFSAGLILRMDATSGQIVKKIPVPGNPYGLVLDTQGSVWVQATSALVKIDVQNSDLVTAFPPSPCQYGIAADAQNRIYTAGHTCLARFDPASESWSTAPGGAGTFYGGVSLDNDGNAWVADYSQLVRFDASDNNLQYLGAGPPGNGGHGCAVDFSNHVWAIDIFNNKAWEYAKPVGKAGGDFNSIGHVDVGQTPYTYSDMTGYQLVNAASRAGAYHHNFTGCGADTNWSQISVDAQVPDKTTLTVQCRVADNEQDLQTTDFIPVATLPPDTSPFKINVPHGNVIQVQVSFASKDNMATPIVASVGAVNNNCGKM